MRAATRRCAKVELDGVSMVSVSQDVDSALKRDFDARVVRRGRHGPAVCVRFSTIPLARSSGIVRIVPCSIEFAKILMPSAPSRISWFYPRLGLSRRMDARNVYIIGLEVALHVDRRRNAEGFTDCQNTRQLGLAV